MALIVLEGINASGKKTQAEREKSGFDRLPFLRNSSGKAHRFLLERVFRGAQQSPAAIRLAALRAGQVFPQGGNRRLPAQRLYRCVRPVYTSEPCFPNGGIERAAQEEHARVD